MAFPVPPAAIPDPAKIIADLSHFLPFSAFSPPCQNFLDATDVSSTALVIAFQLDHISLREVSN